MQNKSSIKQAIKFDKTLSAFDIILSDFKKVRKTANVIVPIVMIAYYIYSLVTHLDDTRLLVTNSIFLGLLTMDFVVVCIFVGMKKANNQIKKQIRRPIGYLKRLIKLSAAGFAIYEIVAVEQTTIETIFALVAIAIVVIQVIIDVVTLVVERYIKLVKDGFNQDMEELRNSPVWTAVDAVSHPASFALELINKPFSALAHKGEEESCADLSLEAPSQQKNKRTVKNEEMLNEHTQHRLQEKEERAECKKEESQKRFDEAKQALKENILTALKSIKKKKKS